MSEAQGADVSYANPAPNLSGLDFVIARATYGSTGLDSRTAQHVKACRSVPGRPLGLYHFAYPDPGDADNEARHFLSIADRYKPEMLALDLEDAGSVGAGALEDWALTFMRTIRGHAPLVLFYSMASWLPRFPRLAKEFPGSLWVAHWNVPRPSCGPWATWRFWQKGGRRGIDYDVYRYSADELRADLGDDMTEDQVRAIVVDVLANVVDGAESRSKGEAKPASPAAAARGWNLSDVIRDGIEGGGGSLPPKIKVAGELAVSPA